MRVHPAIARDRRRSRSTSRRARAVRVRSATGRRTERPSIRVQPSGLLELVAHELRTPVTSLYGATRLLEDRDLPARTRGDLLAAMSHDAARVVRFLDDLLALAEATAGNVRTEPVRVHRLVSDVVRDVLAKRPSRTVTVDRRRAEPPALADPDALRHALRNLICHGLDVAADGEGLRLTVDTRPGRVLIILRERLGPSIPEGAALADPTDGRVEPGGRLWLAAAQALLVAMGGDLSVSWRGAARTVRVSLPAVAEPRPDA